MEKTKFIPLEWYPIAAFDKEADQSEISFIVWLPDGRFNEAWLGEHHKFDGEWRHIVTEDGAPVPDTNDMEPVAFMLIEGPKFTEGGQMLAA